MAAPGAVGWRRANCRFCIACGMDKVFHNCAKFPTAGTNLKRVVSK